MKKILNYLRPIIEGEDGKPSLRRLIAIIFSIGYIRKAEMMPGTIDLLNSISTLIVLLLGLTTVQNVVQKFLPSDKTPANNGTQP